MAESLMTVTDQLGPRKGAILFANGLWVAFVAVLVWLCYTLGSTYTERALNYLVCVLGLAVGWIAGFLAAPLDPIDSRRFANFGKILSAFLTGYVISKLDRFIDQAFFANAALAPTAWARLALFITAAIVMALTVYVNRAYMHSLNRMTR